MEPLALRVVQQLLAEIAFGGGEAVIEAIEIGEAEAPIEVVGLNGIGSALDIERGLIELKGVGHFGVGRRQIAVGARAGSADIHADIHPAIDLNVGLFPPVAMRPGLQSRGEWIGRCVGIADHRQCRPWATWRTGRADLSRAPDSRGTWVLPWDRGQDASRRRRLL